MTASVPGRIAKIKGANGRRIKIVCFPLAMSIWHLVKRFIKNWSEGITPLLASFGYYVNCFKADGALCSCVL